jgi:hypothetical protein
MRRLKERGGPQVPARLAHEEIDKNAWTQLALELVARNAELARDKARLDWIEVNADQIHCSKSGAGNIEMYWIAPTRAAIDAAMEGKP